MTLTSTIIGYWRPYDIDKGTVQSSPNYRMAEMYQKYADNAAVGRHVHLYISTTDLQRKGVDTKLAYLQLEVASARQKADEEHQLPMPQPGTITADQAKRLENWLDGGRQATSYRGSSMCRVCGRFNGSKELTRDGYRYPDGLHHYVVEHLCAVPGLPDSLWDHVGP